MPCSSIFCIGNSSGMKLLAVLAVLAAVLFVVHADCYMALFYEPSQLYLSKISSSGTGYLKASKSDLETCGSCTFKFVTSGLDDGKVAFQNSAETMYFCQKNTYITLSELDIEDKCIYDYEFAFDFDMCSHRVALKAGNGKYLTVSNKYIRATSDSPVYFDVSLTS